MSWNRGQKGLSNHLKARSCPTCKQWMSVEYLTARNIERSKKIKEALSTAEFKGRPRSVDYDLVYKLRKGGMSLAEIAKKLSTSRRTVSRGSIQHALRTKPGGQSE